MDLIAEGVVTKNAEALCEACSLGPFNIDGHPYLMACSMGSVQMSFRCQECHTLWSRTHRKGGGFSWISIPERTPQSPEQGVELPPRTHPSTVSW